MSVMSGCVQVFSPHVTPMCIYEGCDFSEGSLAFCALMWFLCSILCHKIMSSGISLHVECILPFGMPCLSAWGMMSAKTVFSVCISGGS